MIEPASCGDSKGMCPLRGDRTRGLAPFVGIGEVRFRAEPMTGCSVQSGSPAPYSSMEFHAVARTIRSVDSVDMPSATTLLPLSEFKAISRRSKAPGARCTVSVV
jgi:hypothetical protein